MNKEDFSMNQNFASNPQMSVTASIVQLLPVGSIVAFGVDSQNLPPGWLLCDGSKFDQIMYPDLFQALHLSTVVPDLRGIFLRGLDTRPPAQGGHDPDGPRALFSLQNDMFGSHNHDSSDPGANYNLLLHLSGEADDNNEYVQADIDYPADNTHPCIRHYSRLNPQGGPETRPVNAAVNYLIFAGLPASQSVTPNRIQEDN